MTRIDQTAGPNLWRTRFESWLAFDESTRQELLALTDTAEIEDRFYQDLAFGTGGLRGLMGAGTNRMNQYTVRRATQGLADYLKSLPLAQSSAAKCLSVAVAYDSRHRSLEFAQETARVLCANGIQVYLFDQVMPTPVLSFAVRHLACDAGVVLTASHNPKAYNGYKVYTATGCQLVPAQASQVIDRVLAVTDYLSIPVSDLDLALASGQLHRIGDDLLTAFLAAVRTQTHWSDPGRLKIIYTALHGSGAVPVTRVLAGYDLAVVADQHVPDGDFPTVRTPNPEEKDALAMAIGQADQTGAQLVLGTDPDCDRVGVAVRHRDEMVLLSGNQMGALLVDFVAGRHPGTSDPNTDTRTGSIPESQKNQQPTLIKTVVTNELGADIGRRNGLAVVETLTGFKYIGEQIDRLEQLGDHRFVIGYEESFGYLAGTHARDKDAVVAVYLIAQMAAYWQQRGQTLIDRLNDLYETYGFYLDELDAWTLPGQEGLSRISHVMAVCRETGIALLPDTSNLIDYSQGWNGLEPTDLLKYTLTDGSWVAIRPSGTEPKIKIYYSIKGIDSAAAQQRLTVIRSILHPLVQV